MKEIFKENWGLVIFVFGFLLMLTLVAQAEHDKQEHAKFMVENNCVIDIQDKTLGRAGCLDVNGKVFWRDR